MKDTTMKLYYFDIPGRGEAIRLLLRHARVPFEDVRIKFADWPKMKPTFDLQQLPVLECGGERLCQSYAILLSLGRKYGYMSTCPKEAGDAVCDMNTFEDLFNKYMAAFFPMSPYEGAQKTALQEAFVKTDFPFFMGYFEEKLKKNKSKEFMCGTNYTVADFYILGFYKQMKTVESFAKLADSMGTQFPLLKAYFEKRLDDLETSSAPKTVPPRPKLYYFDMEGRASMVRLLLRHAKVDFEDCRVSMADWPAMKDKFALKQLVRKHRQGSVRGLRPVLLCPQSSRGRQEDDGGGIFPEERARDIGRDREETEGEQQVEGVPGGPQVQHGRLLRSGSRTMGHTQPGLGWQVHPAHGQGAPPQGLHREAS